MYACPECKTPVKIPSVRPNDSNYFWCNVKNCELSTVASAPEWYETLLPHAAFSTYDYEEINQTTEKAYQLYSKFYAFFALMAYWIIWRGQLLKHISFFRGLIPATGAELVIDIATGEGSLTELALRKGKVKAKRLVVLDLSKSMLKKAARRFQKAPATLIRGDVMKLPFQDQSIALMSCFGGLNSFPDFSQALSMMLVKLAPGGRLRGSFLLFPDAPWKQRKIRGWIAKGYQTTALNESEARSKIEAVCQTQTTRISEWNRVGDVLLFEITR